MWLIRVKEAQREVLCISGSKKTLHYTLSKDGLALQPRLMGPHSLGTPHSRWHFAVQSVACHQSLNF